MLFRSKPQTPYTRYDTDIVIMSLTLLSATALLIATVLAGRPLNIYLEDGNTYLELGPHPIMDTHTTGDYDIFNDHCFIDQPRIVSSSHVYLGQSEDFCGLSKCKDAALLYNGLWTIMIAKPSKNSSSLMVTYFLDDWYKYHQIEYKYEQFKDCEVDQFLFLPVFNNKSTNLTEKSPPDFIVINNCGIRVALRIETTVFSGSQSEVRSVPLKMPLEISNLTNPLFTALSDGTIVSVQGDQFHIIKDHTSEQIFKALNKVTSVCATTDGWLYTTADDRLYRATEADGAVEDVYWRSGLRMFRGFIWREAGHGNCVLTAVDKTNNQFGFYMSAGDKLSESKLVRIKRANIDESPKSYIDLASLIVVIYEKSMETVFKNSVGPGSMRFKVFDGKLLGIVNQYRHSLTSLKPLILRSWRNNDPVDNEDNSTTLKLHFEQIHLTNAMFSCEKRNKSYSQDSSMQVEVRTARMNYTIHINKFDMGENSEESHQLRIWLMTIFMILMIVVVCCAIAFLKIFKSNQKASIKVAEDMVRQSGYPKLSPKPAHEKPKPSSALKIDTTNEDQADDQVSYAEEEEDNPEK